MSLYTATVQRNLVGCEAVSTGLCPGCDTCRESFAEFKVEEIDNPDEESTEPRYGFKADPDVCEASEQAATAKAREQFDEELGGGHLISEPSFSWTECDVCGCTLGGDRESWHYVDKQGEVQHAEGACTDCVVYLANGDESTEPYWTRREDCEEAAEVDA